MFLAVCTALFFGALASGDRTAGRETGDARTIAPLQETATDSVTKEYVFSTKDYQSGLYSLIFSTRHQFVTAWADGEPVYSLTAGNPSFGNTPGCLYNFVSIPAGTKEVTVRIRAAYPQVAGDETGFVVAQARPYYSYLVKKDIPAIFFSLLSVVAGAVMIVYWAVCRRHTHFSVNLLFLGLFSCIMGLWSMAESNGTGIVMANQQAASFLRYLLVLLMGMPFLFFVQYFLELRSSAGFRLLCLFHLIWIPLCVILQLFRIYDMKQTVYLTHSGMLLILAYTCIGIYRKIREGGERENGNLKIFLAGTVLLFASSALNFYGFYKGITGIDLTGRMGFFIYIMIIGITSARNVLSLIEDGKNAELYRKLAMKDVLTGMFNRNAYIEKISRVHDPVDMIILTFDLNNLKYCNDNLGHMYGDKYLIAAAGILENVFAPYGECYRIGGDEFCVIMQNAGHCNVKSLLKTLAGQQDIYNKSSGDIFMQIACGYALYDPKLDRDIESTRSRADEMMYANKKELKKRTGLGR